MGPADQASVARTFPAGPAGGPRGSEPAVQVRWPRHCSASQGPPRPSQLGAVGPRNLCEKHRLRLPKARGGNASAAPQPAPGQRKELLFLSGRREFCCINQLSEEPNTIKPKQSPKLGGKTSLMHVHWVMLHLWEGTPVRPEGKTVSVASVRESFFHRWAGRPPPLRCSFAASFVDQRAESKWQRSGWPGGSWGRQQPGEAAPGAP